MENTSQNFWKRIYRDYPHAYKAYMLRKEKTDIITDFFAHYQIYVELRDLELNTGQPMWEYYVKSKHFMISHVGFKTEVGAQRSAVVKMFDILDAQLKNQNYLNN